MTSSVATTASIPPPRLRLPVPPNLFGIPFGIVGLGDAWHAAALTLHTSNAIPNAIDCLSAATLLALFFAYVAQGPRQILSDLHDRVLAPFVSLATITAMLLATALARYAFAPARLLVVIFLVATIAVGGWLTGQWMTGTLDQDAIHPGYFLPTVAGGLLGSIAAKTVHLRSVADASFGIGILCWILLGSLILNRLFFRPRLADPLIPTMAIEIAPPVVAGLAYSALTGGITNTVAYALAGYAVLMGLVQLRFLPLYIKLHFVPGFWAFTFSYAAAAADALEWIAARHPAGSTAYATILISATSIFIAAIAGRTVVAVARQQLFPRSPAPPLDAVQQTDRTAAGTPAPRAG